MNHIGRAHGIAPYHLIVEGQAMLHRPGQAPLQLLAGDMLVLPRGQAHTLHIGAQDQLTDILCGQFDFWRCYSR